MSVEERLAKKEEELAKKAEEQRRLASIESYVWDRSQEAYWDVETGTLHNDRAVDGSIPLALWRREEGNNGRERLIPPSKDIMRVEFDRMVEGSTWWPGQPKVIKDIFINKDGSFPLHGCRIYNTYREPPPICVTDESPDKWIDHVKALWPEDAEYFFDYCAHMVQRPQEKCNTAIILSGTQGIGKDAALLPVKHAIGNWNTRGIDPNELFSSYRSWIETLMLVVDEVRPTKDEFHASSMYNILKPLISAPPDTLPMNDKYQKLKYVVNVMRVFITTNDWMAMYIPPEDRRMFVMHSSQPKQWKPQEYFSDLFSWFNGRGCDAVAAWLSQRDISHFDAKAQAGKTMGWSSVANTWSEPEDAVGNAIERLGYPEVIFMSELVDGAFDDEDEIRAIMKSPRKTGHRMAKAGYVPVAPIDAKKWEFTCKEKRVRGAVAYVKQELMVDREMALFKIKKHGKSLVAEKS